MEGQSGGTFSKKWRDKCGVCGIQEPERGKIPFLLLFLPKTYPCGAKVLCAYTLLYIVYGDLMAAIWRMYGEGGTFKGRMRNEE